MALLIGIGLLGGVGLGFFILIGSGKEILGGKSPVTALKVNSQAPDFTLESLSGERISLSHLRGKPVVINFWATWCEPCKREMPLLQSKYDQYSAQFWLLAVDDAESEADILAFAKNYSLKFDVLLDPSAEVQQLFRVHGYPTTFGLDSQGKIRFEHIGELTTEQLDLYLVQVGVSK